MSTMFIDHPSALLPAYVLGALEPDKHRIVESHLKRCVICRTETQALPELLLMSDGESPRPYVRMRLLSRVNGQRSES